MPRYKCNYSTQFYNLQMDRIVIVTFFAYDPFPWVPINPLSQKFCTRNTQEYNDNKLIYKTIIITKRSLKANIRVLNVGAGTWMIWLHYDMNSFFRIFIVSIGLVNVTANLEWNFIYKTSTIWMLKMHCTHQTYESVDKHKSEIELSALCNCGFCWTVRTLERSGAAFRQLHDWLLAKNM